MHRSSIVSIKADDQDSFSISLSVQLFVGEIPSVSGRPVEDFR